MSMKVILGRAARLSVQNAERLERQAAVIATNLTVPPGVEFARFDHAGKTYALSAKVLVEVELLSNRVPDVVVRTGQMPTAAGRRQRRTRR